MRDIFRVLLTGAVIALLMGCGNRENASMDDRYTEAVKRNSVYYWKTVFDLDSTAVSFMKRHDISRVYLRMFDVVVEPDFLNGSSEIVPVATTRFATSVPGNLEIVPVTYITIDALRAMAGREAEFASLIVERLLAMSSYNECGKINELRLDKHYQRELLQIVRYSERLVVLKGYGFEHNCQAAPVAGNSASRR